MERMREAWRPGRRGRRAAIMRRSRGQSLVEFALIVTPFCLVFFSIVEFALITASIGSYNFAARSGARVGSIVGRTDAGVDQQIITEVTNHITGLVMAQPTEIDIFRGNPNGNAADLCLNTAPATSSSSPTPEPLGDPNCAENIYLPPFTPIDQLSCIVCNWPVDSRNDTNLYADYIGVRVLYTYTYVTGFLGVLGSGLNLSTYSMQRIEPQDYSGDRHSIQPNPLAATGPPAAVRGTAFGLPLLGSVLGLAALPEGQGAGRRSRTGNTG